MALQLLSDIIYVRIDSRRLVVVGVISLEYLGNGECFANLLSALCGFELTGTTLLIDGCVFRSSCNQRWSSFQTLNFFNFFGKTSNSLHFQVPIAFVTKKNKQDKLLACSKVFFFEAKKTIGFTIFYQFYNRQPFASNSSRKGQARQTFIQKFLKPKKYWFHNLQLIRKYSLLRDFCGFEYQQSVANRICDSSITCILNKIIY